MSYADHDHRGDYADQRHDHDGDYAEKYHRHYDDESTARGLRQDLAAAEDRIRPAGGRHQEAMGTHLRRRRCVMSAPAWIVIAFLGLLVSARTRVTVPLLGATPVLGLIALAVVLALAAAVLWLLRSMARDGWPGLRPRTVRL